MLRPTAAALLAAAACGACGSNDNPATFPPAARAAPSPELGTAPRGRVVAPGAPGERPPGPQGRPPRVRPGDPLVVLRPRARRLELLDPASGRVRASEPAGVGPSSVAVGDDGRVYVTDAGGGAVLLFRTRPELGLVRRYGLKGAPWASTVDRRRGKLWVTLPARNEVVQLTADGRPREQRRFGSLRGPVAIAVDDASGLVSVAGRDGALQVFDGYAGTRIGSP